MRIEIEYSENELRQLVIEDIERRLGEIPFNETNFSILVKSTQNYKAEWEKASFKALYKEIT